MTAAVLALMLIGAVSIRDVQSVTLRLNYYGSTSYSYGRLEMYYGSYSWTPFIITGFSMHEADLACRQLGYKYASRYATVGTLGYGQATTNYYIYHLSCSSSSTSFSSCTYRRSSSYSSRSKNVGLQCTNSRSSLRLLSNSGYTATSSGRLQININSTWGTVCDNSFGSRQANIACRQMGFSSYISYNSARSSYQYTSYISGPIWYGVNQCSYSSTDLRDCTSSIGTNPCTHSQDIILTCYGSTSYPPYYTLAPTASSGNLRLVPNGIGDNSGGRLEIYYNNYGYSWMPFCSSYFDSHEADLACKKLGYLRALNYGRVGNLGYYQGSGSYSIRSDCSSYTSRFDYCSKSIAYSCSHQYDVAINCVNSVSPTDYYTGSPYASSGDVRLVSGGYTSTYTSSGRLEVYYTDSSGRYSWMPFCQSGFDNDAANSACKQLGFTRSSRYGSVGQLGYGQSTSSSSISSVNCYSSHSTFRYCSMYSSRSPCSHYNDVAITCTYSDSSASPGLIIGLVIGSLVLCSSLFIGVMLCVVVFVMYRKRTSSPRTINVVENPPDVNYRMSDLAARENDGAPAVTAVPAAAPEYTPSQFHTVTLQKEDNYPQNVADVMHNGGSDAMKEDTKDDNEDLYPSDDDEKPLIS